MALVFKVKYQDTLRRWVAPETPDADTFAVTFNDLESKIREFFQLPSSASLAITYVDKDSDVVTLADDEDLLDACLVQRLNPLRLDVQVVNGSSKEPAYDPGSSKRLPNTSAENMSLESFLSALPQATADSVKGFLRCYAPSIDPKLPAACLQNLESAFKNFAYGLGNDHPGHFKFGEKPPHHANRHPWVPVHHPWHGDTTLHWGVECDGCGVFPIEGSRYKSTKESDYDLCESCFKVMGNESDYSKLDRPAPHHPPPHGPAHHPPPHGLAHHPPFHGHYRPPFMRKGPKPFMAPPIGRASFARGPYGWKPSHSVSGHQSSGGSPFDEHRKLDARFVKDVTIFDGTEVAPDTKFTKIWRMSNIGTLPWPQGTRLIHIGGDVLGTDKAVILELPASGVPCGEELKVSVDLVAPKKAGRYVSHWRLSASSGQKFGHRVWVVIQVVPDGEHSPQVQASLKDGDKATKAIEEVMGLDNDGANARRPDGTIDREVKVGVDVVVDSATGVEQLSLEKSGPSDFVSSTRILYPNPTSFHVEDELEKPKLEVDGPKLEVDGFSLVEKPSESTEWFDVSDQGVNEREGPKEALVEEVNEREGPKEALVEEAVALPSHESVLQALEFLGFKDRNLNVSVLRSCNFELESTVDKLLVVAGWDGVLKDLGEMGFNDKPTNVRVLVKNKGSLKQTVKELVKLEKQ